MNKTTKPIKKKYNHLINTVSIAVPIVVALLFGVRIPNVEALTFLPPIYASMNGITAALLIVALIAIKKKKVNLHENLMKTSVVMEKVKFKPHLIKYASLREITQRDAKRWTTRLKAYTAALVLLIGVFVFFCFKQKLCRNRLFPSSRAIIHG